MSRHENRMCERGFGNLKDRGRKLANSKPLTFAKVSEYEKLSKFEFVLY